MRLSDQSFLLSSFFSRFADQILLFIVPLVIFQSTGSDQRSVCSEKNALLVPNDCLIPE